MAAEESTRAGFDRAWELAGQPDPELLHDYLRWVVDDADRFGEAVSSMQWFPPGFSSFLVARDVGTDGSTRQSIQLNLYHEDYPGNEEPHGHSRNACASWYAMPGTHQIISRYAVLNAGATPIEDTDTQEFAVAGNCIIDLKDGRRPIYTPVELGSRLLVKHSVTQVAPLGSQLFNSTEIHHVGFRGPGVAVSAHYKGPEESAALSEHDGLIYYKGLSSDEAEQILEVRLRLTSEAESEGADDSRLGPTTMMYAPIDSGISVEASPIATDPETAEMLILGALRTAERLKKLV